MSVGTWLEQPLPEQIRVVEADWMTDLDERVTSVFLAKSDAAVADQRGVSRPGAESAAAGGEPEEVYGSNAAEGESGQVDDQGLEGERLMLEAGIIAMGEAAEQFQELSRRMEDRLARDALDIGLAVAEILAAGAIAEKPERILKIVQDVIERLDEDERVRIRVAPRMLEKLRALEVFGEGGPWSDYDVVADRSLGEAGCVMDVNERLFDARVKTRIARLRHELQVEMGYQE